MGGLKGLSNSVYDPEPTKDDAELEEDYNCYSFGDDQEFKHKDEGLQIRDEKDSGHVNDKFIVASSSRASKGALEDELGYSSDESLGHIRWCDFEEFRKPPPVADDAL